ncbi:MAG: DUF2569 domain-containing protein [Pseudomonadota bacterium]
MTRTLQPAVAAYAQTLTRRSAAVPRALNARIEAFTLIWAAVFIAISLPRLVSPATAPRGLFDALAVAVPYLLIALAPLAGHRLAAASFPSGIRTAQPGIRLSVYGRWRSLSVLDARANPSFGPAGFMASLLIGLLLNIPVRSVEFVVAMPAVSGNAPGWSQALFLLLAADVVVMSFFYMVCFVMALRTVPLFPRMLLFAWVLDVTAQMIIAREIGAMPGLPAQVALPLRELLHGNIVKVMISAFVWLPYLILSERVNVTYRQRASAAA